MRVLFVSKPITFPFHDGSQCLVRDICMNLREAEASVMGVSNTENPFLRLARDTGEQELKAAGRVQVRPVYGEKGRFAPSLLQNARALVYLSQDRSSDIWHFVFAPNPRTSRVLRSFRRLRRVPVVQTIASPPKDFTSSPELMFGDVVVAQSEWTRQQVNRFAPKLHVEVIPAAARPLKRPSEAELVAVCERLCIPRGGPLLVYPGDLEFSRGATYFAELVERLGPLRPDAHFIYACRTKTPSSQQLEQQLRARLRGQAVHFAGELPSLLPLLARATAVVFPTDEAFGKVDKPIALLEAMHLGTPILSFGFGPLAELGGTVQVPLGNIDALTSQALLLLDHREERERVATAQLAYIEEHASPTSVAQRYETLYRKVLRDVVPTRAG